MPTHWPPRGAHCQLLTAVARHDAQHAHHVAGKETYCSRASFWRNNPQALRKAPPLPSPRLRDPPERTASSPCMPPHSMEGTRAEHLRSPFHTAARALANSWSHHPHSEPLYGTTSFARPSMLSKAAADKSVPEHANTPSMPSKATGTEQAVTLHATWRRPRPHCGSQPTKASPRRKSAQHPCADLGTLCPLAIPCPAMPSSAVAANQLRPHTPGDHVRETNERFCSTCSNPD